jgi:Cu+-exporting ATPase
MTTASVVTLQVSGMSCDSCQHHVTEALASVPGVAAVAVDLPGGQATVTLLDDTVAVASLTSAVTDAGYDARLLEG